MFERCSKIIDRWARPGWLWAGLAVIIFFNAVLFPVFPKWMGLGNMPMVLDLRLHYSVSGVSKLFETLGSKGLHIYRLGEILIDIPYMFFYSFYYAVVLRYFLKRKHDQWPGWIVCLPFGIGIFDFLENMGIIYLIHSYPRLDGVSVGLVSAMTTAKWLMAAITFLALLVIWLKPGDRKNNKPGWA